MCSALLLALPLLGCGGDPFDALDLSTFASPRCTTDGFEILTRYRSPGLTGVPRSIYQKLIQVRSDGTMSELMSKLVGRS